jgi:hypothetical protein
MTEKKERDPFEDMDIPKKAVIDDIDNQEIETESCLKREAIILRGLPKPKVQVTADKLGD